MRPLRLQLQGFSAFADATEVDFTDVELVAFVGPTGSGKSSIIDAITFALYGSVARYDEKAVAPVIHQLSNEARVRLDFELDGQTYTAVRVVRRTRAGGTTREARLQRGDEILAGDARALTDEVERLLGLDFAQFNKTVVLPQGRFADFLHDKPRERGELLRDLLGLGVYARIGNTARELAKSLAEKASGLEHSLDTAADITPERLERLRARVQDIADARADVAATTPTLVAIEQRQLTADKDLSTVTSQANLIVGIAVPDGVAALDDERVRAEEAVRDAVEARDLARAAVAAAEAAETQHRSVAECERQLELHDRHQRAERDLTDARLACDRRTAELASATRRADEARRAVADAADKVSSTRADLDVATRRLREFGERSPLVAALEDHQLLIRLAAELAGAEKEHAAAAARLHQANAAHEETRRALDAAEQRVPAAALAAPLHVGDTCPVCRQIVHRLPEPDKHFREELQRLTAVVSERTTDLDHARALERAADAALTKIRGRQETTVARLRDQPDAATLTARLAQLDEQTAATQRAHQALQDAQDAHDTLVGSDDTRQVFELEQRAHHALAAADAVRVRCEADLAANAAAIADLPPVADLRLERDLARQLAVACARARRDERAASDRVEAAEGAANACRRREREARTRFEEARDRVAVLAPPRPPERLVDAWQQLADWARQQAALLRERADEFRARATQARNEHAAVFAALRDRVGALLERPGSSIAEIDTQLAAADGRTAAEAGHLERELARIDNIRREVRASRDRAEVAQVLGQMLRADRFERWLLEEAVEDLVARATLRLRELTGGQYSITAADGTFEIIDHRNADEVRDARSLSGGETFLTSLALALALADSTMELAAEGSAPLESIFLDEGFGSLDPDTLDVVTSSIEELGATGRLVGIVTHIRELAERMPTQFEVHKGATSSSVVRIDT